MRLLQKTGLIALAAAVGIGGGAAVLERRSQIRKAYNSSSQSEGAWFDLEGETEENFDFGLDDGKYYIDLNSLEYEVKDDLDCYLFIGTDHSGNEDATDETYRGTMGDFLLLAVLNNTKKTYGFVQFNRDTMTTVRMIDENGEGSASAQEQLCIAHWYGGSRQMSCRNMVTAVSDMLGGLKIDGYYSVGMDNIARLNSVIGGATVKIEDDFSSVDPTLVKGKTIKLNDEQAYNYLSARMDVGDGENESRMRRQRTYMEAVYNQVVDKVKTDKSFLQDVTDKLDDAVTTDMNGEDFAKFRDSFRDGESFGIVSPAGSTAVGSGLQDGLEHTEFYMDDKSAADILIKFCGLEIDEFKSGEDLQIETESEAWW